MTNLARPLDVRDEAGTKRTGCSVGYTNFGAERWSTCCLGNVGHDGVELQVTPEVSGGSFDGAVVVLIEKCDKAGSVVVDRGDRFEKDLSPRARVDSSKGPSQNVLRVTTLAKTGQELSGCQLEVFVTGAVPFVAKKL